MQIILIVCYPVFAHLAVWANMPMLQAVALVTLAGGILFKELRDFKRFPWIILGLIALCAFTFSHINDTYFLIYIPSIIIPALLLVVFSQSLLPNHIPLVTDIGEKARGPLTEGMRNYTRSITILWAVMFAVLSLGAFFTAWIGPPEAWSLLTNVINYFVIGLLFFGEFLYRKWKFPEHNHPNLFEYIRIIMQANIGKAKASQ